MRKWIVAVIVLVVVATLIGVAVGNLNGYLNRNKDWIAERIEQSLGRKVEFDRIGVSLAGGLFVAEADAGFASGDASGRGGGASAVGQPRSEHGASGH